MYHQPHREFLHLAKKSNEFKSQMKIWLKTFRSYGSYDFLKLVLWSCFENEETIQLKHWSIVPQTCICMCHVEEK